MSLRKPLARSAGLVALLAVPAVAAAQSGRPDPGSRLLLEVVVGFVVSLVINLILAGALLAFATEYAGERLEDVHEDPGGSFLWGLAFGVGIPILLVILAVTVVGLIVALPGAIALFVVGIAGNAVTVLWVGSLLTGGTGSPRVEHVAVGALAMAVLGSIPVVGRFLASVVGLFGLGAVGRDLYLSWRGGDRGGSGRATRSRPDARPRR